MALTESRFVCGTGAWTGPVAGDPNLNDTTLAAIPVLNGVSLSWTYPSILAEALAYTVIYRGTENDSTKAIEIAKHSGNVYLDMIEPVTEGQEFYYWISLVSVHGTKGAWVGPASASPLKLSTSLINALTSSITLETFDADMKLKMTEIQNNALAIEQEAQERIADNQALTISLGLVQSGIDQAQTSITAETTNRIDAHHALVTQMDTLTAANLTNTAAIQEEASLRTALSESVATKTAILEATINDNYNDLNTNKGKVIFSD